MVTVKRFAIEAITKPMKLKGLTKAVARLDGERLDINLEALFIEFESQRLELDKIAGTKGGYRYFFLCPRCQKRCRVLYKREIAYYCRMCQGIHKQTLNRSKTDCQYYWELALKEARKIDPYFTPKRGGYMFDGFPERPKYMRINTYLKHYRRFRKYVEKGDSLWLKGF